MSDNETNNGQYGEDPHKYTAPDLSGFSQFGADHKGEPLGTTGLSEEYIAPRSDGTYGEEVDAFRVIGPVPVRRGEVVQAPGTGVYDIDADPSSNIHEATELTGGDNPTGPPEWVNDAHEPKD